MGARGRVDAIAAHLAAPRRRTVTESRLTAAAQTRGAKAYTVTQQQIEMFERDGCVRVAGVFGPAEMGRIEDELARYMAEEMPSQPGPWDGKNHTCEVPGDLSTVWRISPVEVDHFLELSGGVLRDLWEALFKAKAASVPTPQFFDKYPNGTKHTPPHQDGGFTMPRVLNGCTDMGNCVIVLDDMDEANGCLHYVHGSHKDENGVSSTDALRQHKDGVVGFSRALSDWSDADAAQNAPMICKRGDVLVHHCLVIHGAGVNATSDRHRRTIGFSYQSTEVEMGPEIVNKGLVVNGKLVQGLYNDSEADAQERFSNLSKEDMLQAIKSWGLDAPNGRTVTESSAAHPQFELMSENELRAWLREHAAV
eukprot:SAG31_NODE_2549_length_5519_cov_2.816605_6_plen_365_part_00